MSIRPAEKLGVPKGSLLRGLMDTESQHEYVYLKDAFEYGGHSQLFVGARLVDGQLDKRQQRVFKRVSALDAHSQHGLRSQIAAHKRAVRIEEKRPPSQLPWEKQGTMPLEHIHEEIAAIRDCKSEFARQTEVLATARSGVDQLSKYFYIMPAAPADLLECIHALVHQDDNMRRQVALMVLRQLATQLRDMHAHGRVHRDVRSENILCLPRKSGPEILLWDFGHAISGKASDIAIWKSLDLQHLGKVFAMLLAPDRRELLEDHDLLESLHVISGRFADLTHILRGLCAAQPTWHAEHLLSELDALPQPQAANHEVATFIKSLHALKEGIDASWDQLEDELSSLG